MTTLKTFLEEKRNDYLLVMNEISKDFAYDYDSNDNSSYIDDCFTEYADSQVDIYTSDLLEWANGNYSYIEDYVNEFGQPEKFDFIHLIQCGQFYQKYQELCKDEEEIKAVIYLNKLLYTLEEEELNAPITEELEISIENILDSSWCDLERFDEYEDLIIETFDFKEE